MFRSWSPVVKVVALCLALLATTASAQYPNRPIRFIIPFPPGGGLDITARTIQQKLSEALGVAVVIENKAGAAGTIGADFVAKATPDGYTILLGNIGTMALYPATYDKVLYNTMKDLTPVAQLISNSLVAVIPSTIPAKTLPEYIAWVKQSGGKHQYASGGSGAITHLAGEMLKVQAGINMLAVTQPHIKSGKLRAIGVTGSARLPALPEVPTFDEAGLKGYSATGWQGVFAPAGTPKDVIDKLAATILKVMNDREVQDKFVANGAEPTPLEPEQFRGYVGSEIEKWTKIAKAANVKVDY